MTALTEQDFLRLSEYIRTHYGINLSKKQQLIESRLHSFLEEDGYRDFHAFVDDIISGRRADLTSPMLDHLTTNYTYFLREETHFQFFTEKVIPWMKQIHRLDKSLSIWSAGCSSGEEAFTISMYLKDLFDPSWDTRILATDISTDILDKAKNPVYVENQLDKIPKSWKNKYFVKKPNGTYTICEEIQKNVIFRPFNLMNDIHFKRKFDLIFCRNVMIYFDQKTREDLVDRFYDATVPGGYLFIGHSEGLQKEHTRYQYIQPAIYQRRNVL